MDKKKAHIVMFDPSLGGMGHLIPFCELAKLLASRHGFSITFIMTAKLRPVSAAQTAYTQTLSSSGLSIRFIELPAEAPMDSEEKNVHPIISMFKLVDKSKGLVGHALRTLLSDSSASPISAFITDLFGAGMLEVSTSLNIPSYIFFIVSASNLSLMLYHPTMDAEMKESLKDIDGSVKIPGLPAIPAPDLPDPMQDKSLPFYHLFLRNSYHMFKADGILINTFQDLESNSIQALVNGELLRSVDGISMPNIYPVGPIISSPQSDDGDRSACLQWLDQQPPSSVIFVSFGSLGFLSGGQIRELALGLEGSGQRFLWVLRNPPNTSGPDVCTLLPPGFQQRTKDRGLVVTSWAPQVAILAHPSTGGIVSQCGWNSVLESVSHGVPLMTWPLHAEQRTTAFLLVNDIQIALGTQKAADGIVTKEEVEKAARELMEGEDGKKKRARARELKQSAQAAVAEGGSSSHAMAAVVALWKSNSSSCAQ